MTTKQQKNFLHKYTELRKQLAELGRRFLRASSRFPASFYEFIEADSPLASETWSQWIKENRTIHDLEQEKWDIFPANWTIDSRSFDLIESNSTRICGMLSSPPSTIEPANRDLSDMAATGIKILLEIRDCIQQCDSAPKGVEIAIRLPGGHRGWLDLVRITAENNRASNLMVEYNIFLAERDRASQSRAIANSRKATQRNPDYIGFLSCRITPDIFLASANAIGLWLRCSYSEPIRPLVSRGLPDLFLPSLIEPDEALLILHGPPSPGRLLRKVSTRKPKRKAGRPRVGDPETDRKIHDARSQSTSIEQIARGFGLSEDEVKKRLDRERKRQERAKKVDSDKSDGKITSSEN